jgi:hypothetical protein
VTWVTSGSPDDHQYLDLANTGRAELTGCLAMEELTRRAGYFAAHGIWCVSEGETLIPIMVTTHADGTGNIDRLMYDDVADGARAGKEALAAGHQDWV